MDWENERYVRLYTRDSSTWLLWPWQARAVFALLLRKVDRAGVMDIGEENPVEAVSAHVQLPIQVVEVGLPAILRKQTAVIDSGRIVIPHFMEAQEARSSDAQRQRDSRERRRALKKRDAAPVLRVVTERDAPVTERDERSRSVTNCHNQSHGVTPSLAEPSQTKPSNYPPNPPRGDDGENLSPLSAQRAPKAPRDDQTLPLLPDAFEPEPQGVTGAIDGEAGPAATTRKRAARQVRKAAPTATESRKRTARDVLTRYEQQRIALLHAGKGQPRALTDADMRAMVSLMRHIVQERSCDEATAWEAVEEYGQLALSEAAAAMKRGDEDADRIVGYRRGPNAWRKSRYETVMSKHAGRQAVRGKTNGHKRKVKSHPDGTPYIFVNGSQHEKFDQELRLPGEQGYDESRPYRQEAE